MWTFGAAASAPTQTLKSSLRTFSTPHFRGKLRTYRTSNNLNIISWKFGQNVWRHHASMPQRWFDCCSHTSAYVPTSDQSVAGRRSWGRKPHTTKPSAVTVGFVRRCILAVVLPLHVVDLDGDVASPLSCRPTSYMIDCTFIIINNKN